MTVREMEEKTGLDRANIRFYEREGFLEPERRENGYRSYSEGDLQTLLRIKLLRRLGLTLEQIRAAQSGEADLQTLLEQRQTGIRTEQAGLTDADRVCGQMRQEGARFETLDAPRYLRALEQPPAPAFTPRVFAAPKEDRVYPADCPWRRFFARSLDFGLAGIAWYLLLGPVLRFNLGDLGWFLQLLLDLAIWMTLIPLEALCLSRWGTTPGKWLLGLGLEHTDGRLLRFDEAAARAWDVLGQGEGWCIPFLNLWRNWKSYKLVREGQAPDWDWNVTWTVRTHSWKQTAAIALATLLVQGFTLWMVLAPSMPLHKGADLTPEQFLENYNGLCDFYGIPDTLEPDGTLTDRDFRLQITVEEGAVTGVSYHREVSSPYYGQNMDAEGKNAMQMCFLSLAGANASMPEAIAALRDFDSFVNMKEGAVTASFLGWDLVYRIDMGPDFLPADLPFMHRTAVIDFSMTKQ